MKKSVIQKLDSANAFKIQWRAKAQKHIISFEEFNELTESIQNQGYRFIDEAKTTHRQTTNYCWTIKTYAIDTNNKNYINLYLKDEKAQLHVYMVGATDEAQKQLFDNEKRGGTYARNYYNNKMKTLFNVNLNQAFGILPHDRYSLMNIVSALKQLIYFEDTKIKCKKLKNVYKADFSSAFPSTLCGSLPNANTAKLLQNIVEPNEEYPFAFYPVTGDLCIYNELDTRKWHTHSLYKKIGNWRRLEGKEFTVLMKPSKYKLDEINQELYDKRKEDPNCKLILNSFIGYLRSMDWNADNLQPHVALTSYARHIQKMLNAYDLLIKEGNSPILYMTDCILWCGQASKAATKEKKIGAFVSEFEDCIAAIAGCGIYAIEKDGVLSVAKHQGTSDQKYRSLGIKTLNDFIDYYKNKGSAHIMQTTKYNAEKQKFEIQEVYIRANQ